MLERRRVTTAFLGAVAIFAGGFALASCGGDDGEASETTPETTTTETTTEPEVEKPTVVRVTVVDGSAKGILRASVDQGDRVRLVVTSDVADEIHLHGYDISRAVEAGGTVTLAFRATIPGRFEVELEDRGVPIADITVEP